MQAQSNNKASQAIAQASKSQGRTEATSSSRYILQLNHLLRTARRMNNGRVILALSQLITRRGGIA